MVLQGKARSLYYDIRHIIYEACSKVNGTREILPECYDMSDLWETASSASAVY